MVMHYWVRRELAPHYVHLATMKLLTKSEGLAHEGWWMQETRLEQDLLLMDLKTGELGARHI
ncbi:MAG: hypothetical protein ACXADX_01955 [Candidatus Hodarchaeales archaeon]